MILFHAPRFMLFYICLINLRFASGLYISTSHLPPIHPIHSQTPTESPGWKHANDVVHGTNTNTRISPHSSMNGIIGQADAIDVIVGIDWDWTSDFLLKNRGSHMQSSWRKGSIDSCESKVIQFCYHWCEIHSCLVSFNVLPQTYPYETCRVHLHLNATQL